jgi:putative acetyltransferase
VASAAEPAIARSSAAEIARLGLLAELDAELGARYPGEPAHGVEPAGFEQGGGCFLLARLAGEVVGCGAFRPAGTDTVEIKRLYVRQGHRGRGLAGRILAALEAEARLRGFGRAILETGTRQPEAIALYRRHGYRPIECFGVYVGNPSSVCFGKSLAAAGPGGAG